MPVTPILLVALVASLLINACTGQTTKPPPIQPPTESPSDINVLFIGNSHTDTFRMHTMVETLVQLQRPSETVSTVRAPKYGYLSDHIAAPNTLDLFQSQQWTHVILQAQKYSQSQTREYPTDAAQSWIRKTKAQGGIPILFPEWGQVGQNWEGHYLFDLHLGIAAIEPACVAPIGPAWDKALMIRPELELHSFDGNHANQAGAFLTALVIAEVISQQSVDILPFVPEIDVAETDQDFLGQMASAAIAEWYQCSLTASP